MRSSKLTQTEIIVRYLWTRQDWVPSYDLMKKETAYGWLGSQGDRRARELANDGFYKTKNYTYTIERRQGKKYAEYRCIKRELRNGKKKMLYTVPSLGIEMRVVE